MRQGKASHSNTQTQITVNDMVRDDGDRVEEACLLFISMQRNGETRAFLLVLLMLFGTRFDFFLMTKWQLYHLQRPYSSPNLTLKLSLKSCEKRFQQSTLACSGSTLSRFGHEFDEQIKRTFITFLQALSIINSGCRSLCREKRVRVCVGKQTRWNKSTEPASGKISVHNWACSNSPKPPNRWRLRI